MLLGGVGFFLSSRSDRWAPRLARVGGFLGTVMFLTTLSFIVTTPGIGDGAAFLMKDLTLLGGALWTAGAAWVAVERQTPGAHRE